MGKNAMARIAVFLLPALLGGCVSLGVASVLPVEVLRGEQLRPWGVEAGVAGDTIKLKGQVDRTSLPTGPLREHVHVEVRNAAGEVLSVHDADIYPFTALRSQGTARLSLDLSRDAMSDGDRLKIIVVDGAPHE
jgi:hypothetical protein